ncbi:hypothetical protein C7974DRAFT_391741 [Boeremia exigua]|uniref:uncharacterized protein n=1 Tax=Boeremia exigua TaxID=749465 RepID=UPI001E8D15A0|nr:uncharacterized protein C7974DRAFT_391741 [Boeremia exigua]KAH6632892.1 hypothetical protein C7974DRAFT_391741 [Boeremia exigua]
MLQYGDFRIAKLRDHPTGHPIRRRRPHRRAYYMEPWLLRSNGRQQPPLHVAADEWAATLDDAGGAFAFENNLDLFISEARTGQQTWSAATTEGTDPSCPSRIAASGDTRIWHRKVEDWVRSLHPPEATSRALQTPMLRRRTDLVEALMSHGILRDNDMRVLSENGHSLSMTQSHSASPTSPVYVDSVGEASPQSTSDDSAIGRQDASTAGSNTDLGFLIETDEQ